MLRRRGEQEKLRVGEEEEGALGLLRPNPKRRRFGLVFNFFKNQNTLKRHRFGVPDIYIFFKRYLQNDAILCV